MRKPRRQTALKLVLSAAMLAWGTFPPAVRHGHEGGSDRDHSHECLAEHDHHRDRQHEHDGEHHHHDQDVHVEVATLSESAVHLHWGFFGFDFTLPAPDGEHAEDPDTPEAFLVRLVRESPGLTSKCDRGQDVLVISPPASGFEQVAVRNSSPLSAGFSSSIPLCDSARFERTGVLLA